jgi:hypothetical protein
MWDDPRLDLPSDSADSLSWPLQIKTSVLDSDLLPTLEKLPPKFESFKRITTKSRVDEDIAVIGQLIGDEVGPTTRGRVQLLKEYEKDEVNRLVHQEALYSDAQDHIVEEEKSDSTST